MTGYPINLAAHGRPRSMEQALADLCARLKAMPLNSPARGDMIRRIVALEDEIAGRRG